MTTTTTDMTDKRNLWYFGLEPLEERYTHQLSTQWTPSSYEDYDVNFISLDGKDVGGKINVGSVLDAVGRGIYSMNQCSEFLRQLAAGNVKENDIILLQDFWTPGIESVFYALDLYNVNVKLYSMLHAQSVDEYDFTHSMRHWMRDFELGIDKRHSGIFVGSTIHKQQLRQAGFKAPIHVVSLPIHKEQASEVLTDWPQEEKQVIFTSRYDKEKNPYFMLKVAESFLARHPDYKWVVTTSGQEFRSSDPDFINAMKSFASENDRFVMLDGLTKKEYYAELAKSKVQFNSSLQDYVSWTLIESTMFGCDVCYPNFRSFPEILPDDRMYKPFNVISAVNVLDSCIKNRRLHYNISNISDLGRRLEAYIIMNDITVEYNVWHEHHKFDMI